MSSHANGPVPHPKLQQLSGPRRSPSHWHPYAPTPASYSDSSFRKASSPQSPSLPAGSEAEQQVRDAYHRQRRAYVTACDSCRLRKLKCNAKSVPQGESCSACQRQCIQCTFDDRDIPSKRPIILPRPNLAQAKSGPYRLRGIPQHRDSGVGIACSSTTAGKNSPQMPRQDLYQRRDDTQKDSKWGHEQAGLVLASIHSSAQPPPDSAIWDTWNAPLFLTDPNTSQRRSVTSQAVVELLMHRFYAQPSFNCIVVPNYAEMIHKFRRGAIPPYLLHTIIACAAASKLTQEPELLLWRSQVWHGASESVHRRLNTAGPPELDLVQSLLLLATNWSGGLIQMERVNAFYTAVNLALSLQLHSGQHLHVAPGPRSTRIMLFWALYCTDKILAVMTKRQPVLCKESHSMPLPSVQDIEAASGLPPKTTVAAWLQRLAFAYIALVQITECIQRQLLIPIRQSKIVSLDQIFHQILPIEKKLESFCKEQRWLLGIVTELSPLCRTLAEAVISQLHFTQLHLYLPALQLEVDRRGVRSQPLRFSAQNDKPLAATIESAWHLVQQPSNGSTPELSSISQAARGGSACSTTSLQEQNASPTFSHASVLIGLNFFKFLSTNWAQWDQGRGCLRYAPIRLSQQFLRSIDPHSQPARQIQSRDPLQDFDRNREAQRNTSEAERPPSSSTLKGNSSPIQPPEGGSEQTAFKRQGSISRRHNLSPLHIAPPDRKLDVEVVAGTGRESVVVTTPARVLFDDEDSATSKKAQDKQPNGSTFATLNSHAMLKPIQPDLLQAIEGQETSQEELNQLAEVLG